MNQPIRQPATIETMLAAPNIRQRFNEMLGARAPQFISSIITVYKGFTQQVEPSSVIASAAIAATLDLPIEKNLGFAHIVPYSGVAQFQMGFKGYVQLALRSGQYAAMNAVAINQECFGGYDNIGDPIIRWDLLDETKDAIGYVFAWRLVSGFAKTVYWPKAKVIAHAERFSQAYKKKKADSPWSNNFDAMALKTVISNALRRWGILSVQMQTALKFDQTISKDIDAEPQHEDDIPFGPAAESKLLPAEGKKRRRIPAAETSLNGAGSAVPVPGPEPTSPPQPADESAEGSGPGIIPIECGDDPVEVPKILLANAKELGITEHLLMLWARGNGLANEKQDRITHLSTSKLVGICQRWPTVVKEIKGA